MKEQRNCNYELRATPESRTVEGYALVFDKESRDLGGFIEIIDPSSLNGVIEKSDILCLLNHNISDFSITPFKEEGSIISMV